MKQYPCPLEGLAPLVQSRHSPSKHFTFPLHLLPHWPQFLGSEEVLTHWLSQTELPDAQATLHCPSLQVGVPPGTAGHLCPHAPQLLTSARGSTQLGPHWINGL